YLRIERDNAALRQKVAAATNSLARTFDRILGLLTERGYVTAADGSDTVTVTDDGRLLARIYSESDLLVAECLRTGAWDGLNAAELAAMVSAVLYEPRGSDGPSAQPDAPTAGLRRALAATRRLSGTLRRDENRHRIGPTREPDAGFVTAMYRWATTGDLTTALMAFEDTGGPLSAGDFVRWCRQVLDLLDQVRNAAAEPALRAAAKRAIDDVRRGVVATDNT
ncbi:DEAD/DEAH box helicase, partial [Mycolicibacterium insubricum]|nr:DEAD/DEAH box helicase [Mycolicibacterium insubricum]